MWNTNYFINQPLRFSKIHWPGITFQGTSAQACHSEPSSSYLRNCEQCFHCLVRENNDGHQFKTRSILATANSIQFWSTTHGEACLHHIRLRRTRIAQVGQ